MAPKKQDLHSQMEAFLADNPALEETLRLFHISNAEYQATLNAQMPRIYTGTSTVDIAAKENHGSVASRRERNKLSKHTKRLR